jgi:hypothetical protein
MRIRLGRAEPEVCFRIVHLAQVDKNRPLLAPCREQAVDVAFGPNVIFERGTVGPRVVELLRKALEWNPLSESGQMAGQADIACFPTTFSRRRLVAQGLRSVRHPLQSPMGISCIFSPKEG